MPLKLSVNGRARPVQAPADMPLLWVLRDILDLKGTKYGCGISVCGMCTVHIHGEATRSCITPVGTVAGKRITTIEGLSDDGSTPVQRPGMAIYLPHSAHSPAAQTIPPPPLL